MAGARFFRPKLTFQQAETIFRGLNLASGVFFATYLDSNLNKRIARSEKFIQPPANPTRLKY